ncbi:MAG: nucleotidyltransferase substrate binding protein [Bacteroidetes bacterium]|nr:nucleotidyltransferase substrate binding protein [Bacteroidota bacterium]
MSNTAEIRWHQRFENFHKALTLLASACEQSEYSDLERAGLVQTFEFSFELAWNTLKDLLFHEGHDPRTPQETIRTAFTAGYLTEAEAATALDALDKRNLLSHSYDETAAEEAVLLIRGQYAPMLLALHARLDEKRSAQ